MSTVKEAMLYTAEEEGAVRCGLCAHRCRIGCGKRGFCGVRENRDGTLFSLVYGAIIAEHMDPIEKKPIYHFLPGTPSYSIATPGCNFRCGFCQNWQISQTPDGIEKFPVVQLTPEQAVNRAHRANAKSVAYTYTEPTIFMEYALDCARLAHEHGIANVFVTNGYETPEAVAAMAGLIDAANVDLKSYSDDFYRKYSKARLQPVLDTIRNMHTAGIKVEVTALIVPGANDDSGELRGMAEFIAGVSPGIPWHVSRFHPNFQLLDTPATPAAKIFEAVEIGRQAGLQYIYAGNLPTRDCSDTVCPKCDKVVISRVGFTVNFVKLDADGKCTFCGYDLGIRMA